ncbi:MAG: hypothetical protein N2Z21_02195 [Candidatus Sumerlaeaceae bacterium]|nr:hypothetical protein [Candidatus Sumerlaeaceae bacterium]
MLSRKPALVVPLEFPEVLNLPKPLVDQLGAASSLAFTRLIVEQVLRQILPVDDAYRAFIMFRPKERTSDVQQWLAWTRGRATLEWNEGHDQPQLLCHAISFAFDEGAERVLVVEPSCLEIRRSRIEELFAAMDENDLLIGPTPDRRLYALGCRRPLPHEWLLQAFAADGHLPVTLAELAERAGWNFAMLDDALTIRTPGDLAALPADVRASLPTKFRHALAVLEVAHDDSQNRTTSY